MTQKGRAGIVEEAMCGGDARLSFMDVVLKFKGGQQWENGYVLHNSQITGR